MKMFSQYYSTLSFSTLKSKSQLNIYLTIILSFCKLAQSVNK